REARDIAGSAEHKAPLSPPAADWTVSSTVPYGVRLTLSLSDNYTPRVPDGRRQRAARARRARRTVLILRAGTGASNNLVLGLKAENTCMSVVGCHHDVFLLKKSTADRNFLISKPGERGYAANLARIIEKSQIDLVIPNTDEDVKRVSGLRDQLPCRV